MKFSNRKYRGAFSLLQIMMAVAIIAMLATLTIPKARAQLTPTTLLSVTNLPAVVTAIAGSNTTSYVDLRNNAGLALAWKFNLSAGTSNANLLMYPSPDGTNYETVPWSLAHNGTGATDVVATTNWSPAQLRGYVSLKFGGMTNANNGTLTNKGIILSRPNP